jgi:murein DD-endopeptidase MepM/ murein hydrolase activator NlpD
MFSLMLVLMLAIGAGTAAADDNLVTVYGENQDDGSVILYAASNHIIPVYLQLDLPSLTGMETDARLPYGAELAPGSTRVELFRLTPTRSSGRIGYSVSYTYARGNPSTADHDDDHLYLVPFRHGDKRRLSQGFQGSFSHYGENEHAVDFEMPIGTEVYAARDGIVAEIREDSRVGGPSGNYSRDGNFILIMHDDGSFANYVHLQYGGAIVEPGDNVVAGELIGYSGNTGRSSGPHLHFDVRIPQTDGTMKSIPFLFRGKNGEPVEPVEGRFYYAYHPGGAPFEEELGRDISFADFSDYAEPVSGLDSLEVRVEQVDLTFLIFIQNGLDRDVDTTMRFDLRGLRSELGQTVETFVPAKTELLVTILRPIDGANSIQYGYRLSYR